MSERTLRSGNAHILYEANAVPDIAPGHFDPAWWQARGDVVGSATGRGAVCFVRAPQATWVLRHYYRGGFMQRLHDRFVWQGLQRSRPWREWRLTAALRARGLPVPEPVAAQVVRRGMFYRGDLITRLIDTAQPLAEILLARALPAAEWRQLGAVLRGFHDAGVRHDDINVSNVLRDAAGTFHLIDFDKAHLAAPGSWQRANLARFRRSLDKLASRQPGVHHDDATWRALENGYGHGG